MSLKQHHNPQKRNDSERRKTKTITIITRISPITTNPLKAKSNKLHSRKPLTIKMPRLTITIAKSQKRKKSLRQNKNKSSRPRTIKMQRKTKKRKKSQNKSLIKSHNQRLRKRQNRRLRKKNNQSLPKLKRKAAIHHHKTRMIY